MKTIIISAKDLKWVNSQLTTMLAFAQTNDTGKRVEDLVSSQLQFTIHQGLSTENIEKDEKDRRIAHHATWAAMWHKANQTRKIAEQGKIKRMGRARFTTPNEFGRCTKKVQSITFETVVSEDEQIANLELELQLLKAK